MKNYSSFLVTGGTGTFGKEITKKLIKYPKIKRIVIFSRDEQKQYEMRENISDPEGKLRFFIGDVRDKERLSIAMMNVEVVIHAAAMKIVETSEYNPFECVKTNIHGAENVVVSSLENSIKKVIALSTDKACNPINLYGATKLASDKIFVAANNLSGKRNTIFSVVRYGNVLGSRGSIIPIINKALEANKKKFYLTDPQMTRFAITIDQGVDFVLKIIGLMSGGEIFVPKIPSFKVKDLMEVMVNKKYIQISGIRPGEKIHEMLISLDDARNTYENKDFFVIKPQLILSRKKERRSIYKKATPKTFIYSSNKNEKWLLKKDLMKMLKSLKI